MPSSSGTCHNGSIMSRIQKLYLSNLLTGLVFWYGIEKLFMQSIGIDATGIGIVTAATLIFTIVFDVPAGLIADRWSRKGQLIISAISLILCSMVLGTSNNLTMYVVGVLFYGAYLVNTSGTYQAIIYDSLHEEHRAADYPKIMGKAYAFFLCGAGLANIASGFIANVGLSLPFLVSVIPPIINIFVLLSIREPTFHKDMQKEKFLLQFADNVKVLLRIKAVRSLAFAWCVFGIIGVFIFDFSQLYMLEYTESTVALGFLWAIFAFVMAFGSFIAHRMYMHLNLAIMVAMSAAFALALIQQSWSLVIFMFYGFMNTGTTTLIEAQIQHNTPSAVRASILSFVSTIIRIVSLPTALLMGWLIRNHGVFSAIDFIAVIAAITFLYWLLVGTKRINILNKSGEASL